MGFIKDSLNAKILLITTVVVLVIGSVFGVQTYLAMKSKEYRQLDANIESYTEDTSMTIRDPVYNFDNDTVQQMLDIHLSGNEFLVGAMIYQEDGSSGVFVGRARAEGVEIVELREPPRKKYYAVKERDILKEGQKIGKIVLYFTDEKVRQSMAATIYKLIFALAFLEAALVAAIYIALNRIITKPLLEITRAINNAADGIMNGHERAGSPLSADLLLENRNDEVGNLHRAMDRLFHERTREMARTNEALEEEIKERKQVEKELLVAKAEAEQAARAKSDFINTVSHELRTPLTSVLGFAKIIRKKLADDVFPSLDGQEGKAVKAAGQIRENVDIIVAEGERLTALINEVLDLAKLESGKMSWNMQDVSIADVIERATAATSSLFGQKKLVLVKELDANLPVVTADRDCLIQVVINLISNAWKFTEKGSVRVTARLVEGSDFYGKGIEVSVADTGVGIAKEDHEVIFEKFRQVGNTLTDKPKGTGLGLPICKSIVEHHGGRIWVESEQGKGSTFVFRIPQGQNKLGSLYVNDANGEKI
ncbi:MAG: HAMP domain-containing histidine kinase [Nitrospirota bacterium]|nr:HAMP domain-containing histidine kinase [Nitrospirota bacterium]